MTFFKERLKQLRLERQLSQSELAKNLGVSQRSISSWETGFRQPDFDTLERIARFFEVTQDYLLGLADD